MPVHGSQLLIKTPENPFFLLVQVTHRETGQVMVLKEILRYDEETSSGFLKEVNNKILTEWISIPGNR